MGELERWLGPNLSFMTSVTFSPDGTRVVAGSDGVRIWNVTTRERIYEGWVTSVAFSSDGSLVVSGSFGSVRIWNAKTGEVEHTPKGHSAWVTSVTFSPDGKRVASGSTDKSVRI
jgi:WD40 repeat protein